MGLGCANYEVGSLVVAGRVVGSWLSMSACGAAPV